MQILLFIRRFILITLVLIFTLYLAILVAFPMFFDMNSFKNQLENDFFEQTGLKIWMEKVELKSTFTPNINIKIHHAAILYPDKREFIKVRNLNIQVKVIPILAKKIYIDKIVADRPILSFDIDGEGNSSLDKYINANIIPQTKQAGFVLYGGIPNIQINKYKIKAYDKLYKEPFILQGEKLIISPIMNTNGIKIITTGILSHNTGKYINYDIDTETNIHRIKEKLFNTNPFRYIQSNETKGTVIAKTKLKRHEKSYKTTGFVLINNLSYKLSGKTIEKNKAELTIEDKKIKINADLKTDEINKIEVTGTFNYGKDKNIDLAISAKSADMHTVKETVEKFLNILNIKNNLNDYDIFGKVNLNFKIKSNFKTMHSEGRAEVSNATVKSKKSRYKFSGINTKINFSNNKIEIEPSEIHLNETPITITGTVDSKTKLNILIKSEELSAEKFLNIFLPEEEGKEPNIKGKIRINAKIKGTAKVPEAEIQAKLRKFTIRSQNTPIIRFEDGNLIIRGTKDRPQGQIILNKSTILEEEFSNTLNSDIIEIIFDKEEAQIPKTTLRFGADPITLSIKVKDYTKEPEFNILTEGELSSQHLYRYLKSRGYIKDIKVAAKGKIGIKGEVRGKGRSADVRVSMKSDANNYISAIVIKELLNKNSITNIEGRINPKEINIKEISINSEEGNGNYDKIAIISGRIERKGSLKYDKIKISIPKSVTFSLEGLKNSEIKIQAGVILDGSVKSPEIGGIINIKDINIPEYKLNSATNKIIIEKGKAKIIIPELKVGKSEMAIESSIKMPLKERYIIEDVEIRATNIDSDEINEIFSETQNNIGYPGIFVPITITGGKAKIQRIKTCGIQAEEINCEIKLEDNILKMKNITGNAYRGDITGNAEYNFIHTSTVSEIKGKKANMRMLMQDLTGKDEEVSGEIDYKVKISTIGNKRSEQLRTAKGYIDYSATKGTMGPLGQFEHFLYAQNLISQSIMKMTAMSVIKAIKPQNTGLYTISKGKIELIGGNAYLKPLTVEGPNMSLYITGKINILNDLADIKIYGRISQEVEKLLGDIANPIPKTIMNSSSETSIGNLFYEEYNTEIPKVVAESIPELNPDSGLTTRLFAVEIQGSTDSVKAVKSFKWITGVKIAPVPQTKLNERRIEQDTKKEETEIKSKEMREEEANKFVKEKGEKAIPDFMENLPDDFN